MRTGDVIEGRYALTSLLGQGGMGQVFRADDRERGRAVAIKTLLPQFLSDPGAARDLEREVRIAGKLKHPRIVEIYEYRAWEGVPYIVMEFVEGRSLSHVVFEQPGEKLSEPLFLALAEPILSAVGYAHAQGVVHRDLKPANILVRTDGQLKLMDFGIAATVRATYTRLTGSASALTIQYASPEQIVGEAPSPGMDIYSLGCLFHEMLTGRPPFFRGDILHQHLTRAPEPVEGVSPRIAEVILACLRKDPAARPATAGEILAALAGDRTIRRDVAGIPAPRGTAAPTAAAPTTAAPAGGGPAPAIAAAAGPASPRPPRALDSRALRWGSLSLALAGGALAVWALAGGRDGRPRSAPEAPAASPPAMPSSNPGPSPTPAGRVAMGALQVIVIPWADVTVDGRAVPAGSLRRLPLAPGPHTVRLTHPDYEVLVRRITIASGQTLELTIDLPEEAQPLK